MNKKVKKPIIIMLCLLIISLPLMLVACDEKNDVINELSQFYGVYENPENNYFPVLFIPNKGEYTDCDFELYESATWDIISVGKTSFTYLDRNNQTAERKCDALLLKALDRLINMYGNKLTVSEGLLYLNDTDWGFEYDTKNVKKSNNNWIMVYDKNYYQIGCGQYVSEDSNNQIAQAEQQIFRINLWDSYVVDENGVVWEIIVNKCFIKTIGENTL